MELKPNQHILFDKVSHSYLLNGEKLLQGATTLLQKHNLMPDYSHIKKSVLDAAAAKGTELHERIEAYDNGETFFADRFIDEYIAVCKEHGLKFLCNELLVSDEELVASMIDGVYEGSSDDSVILVDYKSTSQIHWRPLSWQLSLYKVLFERQFPGTKVEALYVLWLDKQTDSVKGLYPIEPIPDEEVDAMLDCERRGETYVDVNATPDLGEILAPDEEMTLLDNASKIAEMENTLKILKEASESVRDKLLAFMEKANLEKIEVPGGTFTRKKAYTTTRVDAKKVKELYPAIYERVATTSTVKASLTYKPNKS